MLLNRLKDKKMNTDKIIEQANNILLSYDKGNGSYKGNLTHVAWYESDISWLIAVGLFELSKMDVDVAMELRRLQAVSLKHSLLLAKNSTSKFDFTSLLAVCPFVLSIDTNLQSFKFKRDSKSTKVDLNMLREQLKLLELDLIIEQSITRSGSTITSYFYDVTTTTTTTTTK
jgi:hypothetical protein